MHLSSTLHSVTASPTKERIASRGSRHCSLASRNFSQNKCVFNPSISAEKPRMMSFTRLIESLSLILTYSSALQGTLPGRETRDRRGSSPRSNPPLPGNVLDVDSLLDNLRTSATFRLLISFWRQCCMAHHLGGQSWHGLKGEGAIFLRRPCLPSVHDLLLIGPIITERRVPFWQFSNSTKTRRTRDTIATLTVSIAEPLHHSP